MNSIQFFVCLFLRGVCQDVNMAQDFCEFFCMSIFKSDEQKTEPPPSKVERKKKHFRKETLKAKYVYMTCSKKEFEK